VTSVFTFQEVYTVHKRALQGKAIGLDEQPENNPGAYTDEQDA
jgi:hypothetical protein